MISVENLTMRVAAFALDKISFEIDAGEYVVLMGKTGSGKTLLLESLAGLRPVAQGTIRLHGQDVTKLKPAQRGVGYVPQDLALFQTMTVREHLAFALHIRKWGPNEIARRVQELAALLGLARLLDRKPKGLSGGEAQRVALGRTLAFHPQVLLLDEPLSALDDETRADLYLLLESIKAQVRVTTLHITHSMAEAKQLADRVLLLKQGTIRELPLEVWREGREDASCVP